MMRHPHQLFLYFVRQIHNRLWLELLFHLWMYFTFYSKDSNQLRKNIKCAYLLYFLLWNFALQTPQMPPNQPEPNSKVGLSGLLHQKLQRFQVVGMRRSWLKPRPRRALPSWIRPWLKTKNVGTIFTQKFTMEKAKGFTYFLWCTLVCTVFTS